MPAENLYRDDADTLLALAERHLSARALAEARLLFDAAEKAGGSPDHCCAGRWLTAMLAGDFEQAWQQSDAIRRRGTPDPHRFWTGSGPDDLCHRHLIVRCLHGFGDAVQMLRYAPRLGELAASVTYEVPPRLLELAPCFPGVANVVTWGEHAPAKPTPFDLQAEIMELPYLFRTSCAELPLSTRYLHLPDPLVAQAAAAMVTDGRPRIGFVWSAGEWNPSRSVPLTDLQPLLDQTRFEFWNLQGADAHQVLASPIRDALALTGDGILPLAATIRNLDLVITVDTLAAHLAGALGTPAWLLLQHAADWRWMAHRDDSPWYPAMRLFRQPAPGNWPAVVAAVCRALSETYP